MNRTLVKYYDPRVDEVYLEEIYESASFEGIINKIEEENKVGRIYQKSENTYYTTDEYGDLDVMLILSHI